MVKYKIKFLNFKIIYDYFLSIVSEIKYSCGLKPLYSMALLTPGLSLGLIKTLSETGFSPRRILLI